MAKRKSFRLADHKNKVSLKNYASQTVNKYTTQLKDAAEETYSNFKEKAYGKVSSIYDSAVGKLSFLNGFSASDVVSEEKFSRVSLPHPNGSVEDIEYGSPMSFKGISDKIKARYGLPSDPQDASMMERNFINRLNINLVDNAFSHLRCYIFMGKPTCNIMDQTGETTEPIKRKGNLNSLIEDDIELFKFLNADVPSNTDFLTPLQNRLVGMSIQDASMSKAESAASTRGIRQEYMMSYEESMANVDFSLTFRTDRNSEVLRLLYVWVTYIEELKKGSIQQAPEDQAMNRMGYTFPMWIFACEENTKDIVFFAKTVGNVPTSIPFSIFSNQGPLNYEAKEITANFHCSLFRPFDIGGLEEFNALSDNRGPKYFLDEWVPFEERNLDYYWVNGAQVVKSPQTGKYQLVFFTTDMRYSSNNHY